MLKLNSNGLLKKKGHNIVFDDRKEIVQMGVGEVSHGKIQLIDFMSLEEGRGYSKATINFLFKHCPKINTVELKCKNHMISFWQNCGGVVTDEDHYYTTITISRW